MNIRRIGHVGLTFILAFLGPVACTDRGEGPGARDGARTASGQGQPELYRAPAISNEVDGVVWEAGNWEPHLAAGEEGVSWGNHRAVVVVGPGVSGEDAQENEPGPGEAGTQAGPGATPDAVMVTIPWRRRDADPSAKGIVVVDAASGEAVRNVLVPRIENVSGDVIFQPNPGSPEYHVYYLPWQSTGGYYPTITYPTQRQLRQASPTVTTPGESPSRAQEASGGGISWAGLAPDPEPAWERAALAAPPGDLPRARTTHIQSVDDFHSFFPMEVIATPEDTEAFLEEAGGAEGWAVVPEHRDYPVRMELFLPQHWVGAPVASLLDTYSDVSAETPSPPVASDSGSQSQTLPDVSETSPATPGQREPGATPPAGRQPEAARTPGSFASSVLRGEAFTFQLAVVSGDEPLRDVRISFRDFPTAWAPGMTCFNCEGIDEKGLAFTKQVNVPPGTVQPLWIGIQIPEDQPAGTVQGTVIVASADRGEKALAVSLEVQDAIALDGGENEPDLQTRIAWFNSTLGTDPDFIVPPFEPVTVESSPRDTGHTLSILGRRIELAESGLPAQIFSFFTPELTHFAREPEPILAEPLALDVVNAAGETELFRPTPYEIRRTSRGRAEWSVEATSERLTMSVQGTLEYDGMLDYRITLVALEDMALNDIALPVSVVPDAAEYMLGLGFKGGRRPDQVDWKWAVENHQEGVWLGGVHKGLQYVLRDDNYVRPLNTNFYRNQPLNLPPSWFNGGRGGIRIFQGADPAGGLALGIGNGNGHGNAADPTREPAPGLGSGNRGSQDPGPAGATEAQSDAVTAYNYSGTRTILVGDTLHFNIRFLITPFKPIDTGTHFDTRFVHQYVPVDSVLTWGGTVVNIHHANEINPYINYPFFNLEQQAAYIDEAHEKGIKVKLYNTIRELTYKAHELFPMRSLGDEILNDGEGGGHSWMQEHLEADYHSAWHAWRTDDAAMLNKGTSRWTNYYIEGLNWLAANQDMDGLYLDDIAFSRETVKRLVTVLHANRPEVVIDLHSANQFNVRDGFINSAMLYMEHFPFISRLWFGEYFEYDLDEDYWMTEVSGLPFGLMGEMLQDGGHPYRGMLYGMTARKYGNVDPRPVWAMMNDFGIAESRMLGYWLDNAPVTTDHPRVLATTYVDSGLAADPGGILVALASWSDEDEVVSLSVNWQALGIGDETGLTAMAPAVEGLQEEAEVDLSALPVPAGQGLFVVVRRVPGQP